MNWIRQFLLSSMILFYNTQFHNYPYKFPTLKDFYMILPSLHDPNHKQTLSVNIQYFWIFIVYIFFCIIHLVLLPKQFYWTSFVTHNWISLRILFNMPFIVALLLAWWWPLAGRTMSPNNWLILRQFCNKEIVVLRRQ
jgi:hypothetical protein